MDEQTYQQLNENLKSSLDKVMETFRARFHADTGVELESTGGRRRLMYNARGKTPAITLLSTDGMGFYNTDVRNLMPHVCAEVTRYLPALWDECVKAEQVLQATLVETNAATESFLREKAADGGSPSA